MIGRLVAALLLWLATQAPASASVVITFWAHQTDSEFPHAFFTLRGTPDGGGPAVDIDYGFTAKAVTPAILFGSVPGRLDHVGRIYRDDSDAEFSVALTDAQYQAVLALARGWDDRMGDGHYNLNRRNCVHFVKEAARAAGLADLDYPKLMKHPRDYLLAVEAANAGRVTRINLTGKAYLATLAPLAPAEQPSAPMAPGAAPVPAALATAP